MLSETLKKKLTRHFHFQDLDQDGFVEQQDWEQCGRNLAAIRAWPPGSPDYNDIIAKHVHIWATYWKPADLDNDGKVSLDEYLQLAEKYRSQGYFESKVIAQLFGTIFDIIDQDGDEQITLPDYRRYFAAWNLDETLADLAFAKLDLSGDGYISKHAFIQFCTNFYISDDPNVPGNWLFGPYE